MFLSSDSVVQKCNNTNPYAQKRPLAVFAIFHKYRVIHAICYQRKRHISAARAARIILKAVKLYYQTAKKNRFCVKNEFMRLGLGILNRG